MKPNAQKQNEQQQQPLCNRKKNNNRIKKSESFNLMATQTEAEFK